MAIVIAAATKVEVSTKAGHPGLPGQHRVRIRGQKQRQEAEAEA